MTNWPADQVVRRPIGDLIPYARNARIHSDDQIAQVAASIREWGWTVPVLIDDDGTIIAGHARVMAARQLNLKDVPVMIATGWSEAQKAAYCIADNQLAMNAGWDFEMLATEARGLREWGFDLGLLGFADIDELLAEKTLGLTDPDAIPETASDPFSISGDRWRLGRHLLVCGDATDPAIAILAEASQCAMILSDPPYGIGYEYRSHDDRDNEANAQLVTQAFAHGPEPKVWTPGLPNLARDIERFGKSKVICWSKGYAASGNGLGGASTWEPVLTVGRTPRRKLANDVLSFHADRAFVDGKNLRELHTCPKPVALYAALAEALTNPKQLVYDPFCGSGTTIIACEQTARTARAVEIEPAYCDVTVMRWQEFTGEVAVNADTGKPFGSARRKTRKTEPVSA